MAAASLMPPEARLYRAALRLCPPEFRREHGDEMASDFDQARGEVSAGGAPALWTLRAVMGVDLGRTIVVQWWRTGLPVIGIVAGGCSLLLAAGVASVARRVTMRIRADVETPEMVGLVLLIAVAVMVIVTTIVFNLCLYRPRRIGRR
jgi:hypothetical protein